jgi:hypothetical protein
MAPIWAVIGYRPMLYDQKLVEKQSEGHLQLLP